MMNKEEIYKMIYEYKTRYEEGLTSDEIDDVIKQVRESGHEFHEDKYNDAMMGNTCILRENKICSYHRDVYSAIICAVENRKQTLWEWD